MIHVPARPASAIPCTAPIMLRTLAVLLILLPLAACASSSGMRAGEAPSFDGLPLAYCSGGEGDTTLVFVHGWCCNRTMYSNQIPAFNTKYRVVGLDLGGHGGSGTAREDWNLDILAGDVAAVIEKLDLTRVIIIGHSMGGPVAVHAAAKAPDRVVGVIAIDALHDADLEWPAEILDEWVALMEQDFTAYMNGFVAQMFQHDPESPLLPHVQGIMSSAEPRIGIALMRAMFENDSRAMLRNCPVPIRCINVKDGYPTNVEANRKYAPLFDVELMGGVGHFLHMEKPAEFNLLLQAAIDRILGAGLLKTG